MAKVAVIYYSQTGTTYLLAQAVEQGANEAGAETRLLKVRETAPNEVIEKKRRLIKHRDETANIQEATNDDLKWADAIIFGSPTRYGLPSAQLKNFLDQTGLAVGERRTRQLNRFIFYHNGDCARRVRKRRFWR
jgi:NAD(P)H dehydrogenase (quinone)